jgi:hypothetical protein
MTMRRAFGLLASAAVVGAAIVACRPTGETGYVEIKTVPAAPLTQTGLYFDAAKLAPIRNGSALLRQQVGTLTLQANGFGNTLTPLCAVEVKKDRITTVTVSVLERPPRCQCRFSGGGGGDTAAARTCVS